MFQAKLPWFLLFCIVFAMRAEEPRIRSVAISGTNLNVSVTVPAGTAKVTLEGKPRVSRQTWEPRAIRRNPEEIEQFLTIPLTRETELFRIKTENTDILPAEFFTGRSDFQESSRVANGGTSGGATGSGPGWTGGSTSGGTTAGPSGSTTGGTGGAAVVESDVWLRQGQKVYYYNQHRGLHKIGLSDSAGPRLESTYELNATGEQIFALGNDVVLMILSDNWSVPRLVAIDMKSEPRVLWDYTLPGGMYEARLFGSDFIFAAPTHRSTDGPEHLEYGTEVLCLDLSDPSTNRVKASAFLPLWGIVSKATDRFLFIAGSAEPRRWLKAPTSIELRIEGSSFPDALLTESLFIELDNETGVFRVRNGGRAFVPDSGTFEWSDLTLKLVSSMDLTNELRFSSPLPYRFLGTSASREGSGSYYGVFEARAGSYEWRYPLACLSVESLRAGQPEAIELETTGHPKTKTNFHEENGIATVVSEDWRPLPTGGGMNWCFVESFSIANPAQPVRLGFTNFAGGEELFAARFEGNTGYVITTETNDGVWLLDLANPQMPRAAGRLPVPGRTLFVEPLPDRKLLAVSLGSAEGGSGTASLFDITSLAAPALLDREFLETEAPPLWATRSDQAFAAQLSDALVLVPVWKDESLRRVQLVDVNNGNLTIRGTIDHPVEPRRAMLSGDTLLSVSALEVVSASITNRDQPRVEKRIALMRRIDELFELRSEFVEIDYGDNARPPEVRVAKDGVVTQRLILSSGPVARCERRGDLLFLARSAVAESREADSEVANLMGLSVVELSSPLRPRGEVEFTGPTITGEDTHDLLWPSDGTLVWCVNRPRPVPLMPPSSGGPLGSGGSGFGTGWWEGGGVGVAVDTPPHGGLLGAPAWLVFDVADPSAPRFLSRTGIDPGEKTNFSETFVSIDALYVSYLVQKAAARADGGLNIIERTELAVVDLSAPDDPVVRAPITIPANLVAVTQNGSLLFTAGFDFLTNGALSSNIFLTVLAYDGVSVFQGDRAEISHLSSAFIKERDDSVYFLENRAAESALIKFGVGRIPLLKKEAEVLLGVNRLARLWNFEDRLAFGDERQIGFVSLFDGKVSPPLDISALVCCRWWFRAVHLAETSAGYVMPLGYFNPQFVPLAAAP